MGQIRRAMRPRPRHRLCGPGTHVPEDEAGAKGRLSALAVRPAGSDLLEMRPKTECYFFLGGEGGGFGFCISLSITVFA